MISEENKERRGKLLTTYNRTKSKAAYKKLMDFEEEMLQIKENG